MNNVKFEHKKTGEIVIVKVWDAAPVTLLGMAGTNLARSLKPTLARAHKVMLAKGFIRVNRKAH